MSPRASVEPPGMWERLVGQEVGVAALHGALLSGSPGHAWLFAGPEGVGWDTVGGEIPLEPARVRLISAALRKRL